MQNALQTSKKKKKIVQKSPKCNSKVINIHTKGLFTENNEQNKSKKTRVFSDTRWAVRCGALVSTIQHYKKLIELWRWCLKEYKFTGSIKARIIGFQTQMINFNYFLESN